MAKREGINDEDRRQWVLNDEGLYSMQQSSKRPLKAWIRDNRELIDSVIHNVSEGKQPAHYLRYGGR